MQRATEQTSLDQQVRTAVIILKSGGLVAYPTDTLYGLGANVLDADAVARVYRAKERSPDIGLPVLLAEPRQMEEYATDLTDVARELARRFWPGGLTLVVRRAASVPALVSGSADTIALRVPDHPVPQGLVRGLGAAITGTSANKSGMPTPTTAREVFAQLGSSVDYIMDAGPAPQGVASTIVDVTGPEPRLLREGIIPMSEILKAVERV